MDIVHGQFMKEGHQYSPVGQIETGMFVSLFLAACRQVLSAGWRPQRPGVTMPAARAGER